MNQKRTNVSRQQTEPSFLQYLNNWRKEAAARMELSRANRKRPCLSRELQKGCKWLVRNYCFQNTYLLHTDDFQPSPLFSWWITCLVFLYILSERLCQDPLESFFAKQRMRNGYSDNPMVHSFMKGTVSLRIQGSLATNPTRGNSRRGKKRDPFAPVNSAPLPKRKRKWQYICFWELLKRITILNNYFNLLDLVHYPEHGS